MQIAFRVADQQVVAEGDRARELAVPKAVLLPDHGGRVLADGGHHVVAADHVDLAVAFGEIEMARRFHLPDDAAVLGAERLQPALVAHGVDQAVEEHRRAVDVDQAVEFGAPLGQHDAVLPDRRAVVLGDRADAAVAEAREDQAAKRQGRTRAAQGEQRHLAVVGPALRAVLPFQREQAPVGRLRDHHAVRARWARQHLARHVRAPQLAAVAGVQGDDLAPRGAEQDAAVAGTHAAGHERRVAAIPELVEGAFVRFADARRPDLLAVEPVEGHHAPVAVRGVDAVGDDHRRQAHELAPEAATYLGSPDAVQLGLGIEVDELRGLAFVQVLGLGFDPRQE